MGKAIQLHKEENWIIAEVPELPGCISQGRSEAEAMANIQEAIAAWLWAEEQKLAESLKSAMLVNSS
jgi:predicted RNase H-like HicB family nuclease